MGNTVLDEDEDERNEKMNDEEMERMNE